MVIHVHTSDSRLALEFFWHTGNIQQQGNSNSDFFLSLRSLELHSG